MWSNFEEKLQWQKPKKLRGRPSLPSRPSGSRPSGTAPKRRSEGEAEGRERKRQKKLFWWMSIQYIYILYICNGI